VLQAKAYAFIQTMNSQVMIIGAGPVGLTMAAELARYGVPLRIVDKSARRTDKSKALVLWSRTLELLDRAGASQRFVAEGMKVVAANILTDDRPIGRVGIDVVDTPYPFALMLPQSDTERLLEERLASLGVAVERQTELASFSATPEGVDALLLRHADGSQEQVHADWLIGCDGAHSVVRHGLALTFPGSTMESDWYLADVHLLGYPFPDDEIATYWHEDGVLVLFPITAGRYRAIMDVGLSAEGPPPNPTLRRVQELIDRRGPGGIIASDPIWLSSFRINERKVDDYRVGRVFVAGDAAHVHSPAGGQGMNTGMQDAFNLAWKLALVAGGSCHPGLLDSYSVERSAIGTKVLQEAERLTEIGTLRNPLARNLRNVVARLVLGLAPVRKAMVDSMTEVSIGYEKSPLNGTSSHGLAPAAGERMAPVAGQLPPGAGSRPRFMLCAEAGPVAQGLTAGFADLLDPDVRPPLEAGGMWLVRPDGYVACAARADDAEALARYLDALRLAPGDLRRPAAPPPPAGTPPSRSPSASR
jgi:2-polyprenyl-6-methoxyphenol hydroxylase-like FAD-dependent oxidoreductase